MSSTILVRQADLISAKDAAYYRDMLNQYAQDPMGANQPLPEATLKKVCHDLAKHPNARAYLAFDAEDAIGFATVFETYSSFRAQPLWNIHDIAVIASYRGKGIGRSLLRSIAEDARTAGCCKVTLEVRADNPLADGLYRSEGYGSSVSGETEIQYLFLEKRLD